MHEIIASGNCLFSATPRSPDIEKSVFVPLTDQIRNLRHTTKWALVPTNALYALTKSSKAGLGLTAQLTASRFVICQMLYLLLKVKLTVSCCRLQSSPNAGLEGCNSCCSSKIGMGDWMAHDCTNGTQKHN